MRISPKSLSPAEALAKAKAKAATRDEARLEALEAEAVEAQADKTSPAAIDAARAQRLLERASGLASSGDMGAAILAARQALALAPGNVEAHLLHAKLLERNRDFGGARAAYAKGAELAPGHADARANLARLDTYLENSQGAARQFHFDDDELFDPAHNGTPNEGNKSSEQNKGDSAGANTTESADNPSPILAVPAAPQVATPPQKPSLQLDDSMAMFDESMLPDLEVRLPPSRAEAAPQNVSAPDSTENNAAKPPAQSAFMAQAGAVAAAAGEQPTQATPAPAVDERRKHNIPVATERRRRPSLEAARPLVASVNAVPAQTARAKTPVAVPLAVASAGAPLSLSSDDPSGNSNASRATSSARAPLALDIPAAPAAPLWQQVMSRPSFYARTLPLVGVALLSLGFLSWARGRAVTQAVAPAPTELASANAVIEPPATVPGTTLPVRNQPAQTGAPQGSDTGGAPISNAPAVFQAPPATSTATSNTNAPNSAAKSGNSGNSARNNNRETPARANNRGPNSNSNARPNRVLPPARPVPNFPGVSLAPAPIPPASVRNTIPRPGTNQNSADSGGSNVILPSPNIEMAPAPAPRQRVLPPSDNGLNPAGSPSRGYVRVTEGRVGNGVVPAQPSAVARESERAANDSARNGQGDQAISQLSQAIRADSDNAGFRYQQRATLFLQRGDYNRASDDFQSAISAYQNQIASGDDVAQARRGLRSARSGLNLALAGRRN